MRDGTPVQAKMRNFWSQSDHTPVHNQAIARDGFEDGTLGGYYQFFEEGSSWIRGWHEPDSAEVAGLKVAWWMSRSSQRASS